MRRPEVTSWWFILLLWAVLLPLAAASFSSYLNNGDGFSLASFIMQLTLPTGATVVAFLFRSRNPEERVAWVSTPTVYLATTLPMFLFVALFLSAMTYERWSGGASSAPVVVLFGAVLIFFVSLVFRVLEFAHVREWSRRP